MRRNKLPFYGALLLAFLLLNFSFGQQSLVLSVRVQGGEANKGFAMVSLFDSNDNFLKKALQSQTIPIDVNGEARLEFGDLSDGRYAVAVSYDEDGNGKLNTGFLGIPRELVGFSNNARGTWGPPSFEKASFHLSSTKEIIIQLGKAKD